MAEETFEPRDLEAAADMQAETQDPEQPADMQAELPEEPAEAPAEDPTDLLADADEADDEGDAAVDEAGEAETALATSGESAIAPVEDLEDDDLTSEDSLTFSNGVIEKIVALAVRDVPGVLGMKGGWLNRVQDAFGAVDPRKGVTVEVTPESAVRVNISVLIAYGSYAPQIFEDVKRAVVREVRAMTGLDVAGVNLRIEDVLTPEEFEARERSRQKAEAPAATE